VAADVRRRVRVTANQIPPPISTATARSPNHPADGDDDDDVASAGAAISDGVGATEGVVAGVSLWPKSAPPTTAFAHHGTSELDAVAVAVGLGVGVRVAEADGVGVALTVAGAAPVAGVEAGTATVGAGLDDVEGVGVGGGAGVEDAVGRADDGDVLLGVVLASALKVGLGDSERGDVGDADRDGRAVGRGTVGDPEGSAVGKATVGDPGAAAVGKLTLAPPHPDRTHEASSNVAVRGTTRRASSESGRRGR
jgi:hypothetical protein